MLMLGSIPQTITPSKEAQSRREPSSSESPKREKSESIRRSWTAYLHHLHLRVYRYPQRVVLSHCAVSSGTISAQEITQKPQSALLQRHNLSYSEKDTIYCTLE
jgi:hypothetical protein